VIHIIQFLMAVRLVCCLSTNLSILCTSLLKQHYTKNNNNCKQSCLTFCIISLEKIVKHDTWPIQSDILNPPFLRLTSRKPLWVDLQPADIQSRWRHNWKSAQVVNSHLVCDPTIQQPGFELPRQQWSQHGTGTLWCQQKEMATCRHWSLWRDSDDVTHCQILSSNKAEWQLIPAALCRWRRCFQLWFMTRTREEDLKFTINADYEHLSVSRYSTCLSWAIITMVIFCWLLVSSPVHYVIAV